jgi:hypothetical protein
MAAADDDDVVVHGRGLAGLGGVCEGLARNCVNSKRLRFRGFTISDRVLPVGSGVKSLYFSFDFRLIVPSLRIT